MNNKIHLLGYSHILNDKNEKFWKSQIMVEKKWRNLLLKCEVDIISHSCKRKDNKHGLINSVKENVETINQISEKDPIVAICWEWKFNQFILTKLRLHKGPVLLLIRSNYNEEIELMGIGNSLISYSLWKDLNDLTHHQLIYKWVSKLKIHRSANLLRFKV
ncbi:hypothetical protein [Membranihabitans maritimus]|uniref:hypothetical protein n=1 Tax=Membranihabitans maritimus TaxID=2904244 RepID=UPI001F1CAAFB|nr:hypothetical protein [Membranihabitans maritimus]